MIPFVRDIKFEYGRCDQVSPLIAEQIVRYAILAVAAASVCILLYLWWAFNKVTHPLRYGTTAIVALLHDSLIVLGIFILVIFIVDKLVLAPGDKPGVAAAIRHLERHEVRRVSVPGHTMTLALKECGRKLASHLRARAHAQTRAS